MRYKRLGKSSLEVSVVGVGTWAMGGDFWGAIDEDRAIEALRVSLDEGVNLIDTAPAYGRGYAEQIVGKAIKGLDRSKIIVATKCGLFFEEGQRGMKNLLSRDSIRTETERSLKRLSTDYIDLYQCHWPDKSGTPIAETMDALMELRREGKIREIGVSNFSIPLMEECMANGDLASLQPQYSLLSREFETSGEKDFCLKNDIGVLTYGSLGAGALTGKFLEPPPVENGDRRSTFYHFFEKENWPKVLRLIEVLKGIAEKHERPLAQVAINWVTQQQGISCALVGAKNADQARMNARSGEWELTDDDLALIAEKYAEIFA